MKLLETINGMLESKLHGSNANGLVACPRCKKTYQGLAGAGGATRGNGRRCSANTKNSKVRVSSPILHIAPKGFKFFGDPPRVLQKNFINFVSLQKSRRHRTKIAAKNQGSGGPSSTRRQPEVHKPRGFTWNTLSTSEQDCQGPGCTKACNNREFKNWLIN